MVAELCERVRWMHALGVVVDHAEQSQRRLAVVDDDPELRVGELAQDRAAGEQLRVRERRRRQARDRRRVHTRVMGAACTPDHLAVDHRADRQHPVTLLA